MNYIAIPYGATEEIRATRMEQFWDVCSYLIGKGYDIQSPMTLIPAVLRDPTIPYDWVFWSNYSHKMLQNSDKLIVVMLEGWEQSTGVAGEILEAKRLGKEVEYMQWPLTK